MKELNLIAYQMVHLDNIAPVKTEDFINDGKIVAKVRSSSHSQERNFSKSSEIKMKVINNNFKNNVNQRKYR
jgi:hypothetical protein